MVQKYGSRIQKLYRILYNKTEFQVVLCIKLLISPFGCGIQDQFSLLLQAWNLILPLTSSHDYQKIILPIYSPLTSPPEILLDEKEAHGFSTNLCLHYSARIRIFVTENRCDISVSMVDIVIRLIFIVVVVLVDPTVMRLLLWGWLDILIFCDIR